MEYRQYLEEYVINELPEDDLLEIYNELVENAGYSDDRVYNNGESFLDEMFSSPSDAVAAVCYGDYKFTDDFVKFDGYANLQSGNYLTDLVDKDTFLDLLEEAEYNINEYEDYKDEEY